MDNFRIIAIRILAFLVCAGLLVAHPEALIAKTLFVATDGGDTNPCTENSPCATFGRAIPLLVPGDTLNIRGGTYDQIIRSLDFTIPSGTNFTTGAITIQAYSGEAVIFRPTMATWLNPDKMVFAGDTIAISDGTQYVILKDFIIDNINSLGNYPYGAYGVTIGASRIRIQNVEVKNAQVNGVMVGNQGKGGFNELI